MELRIEVQVVSRVGECRLVLWLVWWSDSLRLWSDTCITSNVNCSKWLEEARESKKSVTGGVSWSYETFLKWALSSLTENGKAVDFFLDEMPRCSSSRQISLGSVSRESRVVVLVLSRFLNFSMSKITCLSVRKKVFRYPCFSETSVHGQKNKKRL